MWNRQCIFNLNKILEETNSEIILTSTWRIAKNMNQLNEIFKNQEIIKSPIDITIIGDSRGLEIQEWLSKNIITNFVIIDDKDEDISKYYKNNFFKISSNKSLKDEKIVNDIINFFNY